MAEHYIIDDKEHVYESAAEKHLTDKTITENGTYSAEDEPGDINGYKNVTVDVEGGGGIPVISKSVWDELTTEEKQAYGLVAVQENDTGYIRGLLVSGEDYAETFSIVQINGIGETGQFTMQKVEGATDTFDFIFTDVESYGGVVFQITKDPYTAYTASFDIRGATQTLQMGTCTKDAALPTIITQGTGRKSMSSRSTYFSNVTPRDTNLFMGITGPGSYTVRVSVY